MQRNHNINNGGDRGGGSFSGGNTSFRDHLKDIDLELNLLKRKRDMIEQQQFIQPLMQQSNFNQQPFYQLERNQSGSNHDFSYLYNDGYSEDRKSFDRKRQSDSDWRQNYYPTKRFAGQGQHSSNFAHPSSNLNQSPIQHQQTKSNAFKYESKPTSFKYGQTKQFFNEKNSTQKQQRPEKKYLANKVTKSTKAFVPPNKLSQPVADRKKLISTASMWVAKVGSRNREALRMLPNKEPTNQMTGRLELALGTILKDIREMYAENKHHEILRSSTIQRVIKQTIRERIRHSMLGKIVGTMPEIVKEYRAMYPTDTDVEIVNIALEAAGIKPEKNTKPTVREKPEEYFKKRIVKLIEYHLNDMFDKVEKLYNPLPEKDAESSKVVATEDPVQDVNRNEGNESVEIETQETDVSQANVEGTNSGVDVPVDDQGVENVKEDIAQTVEKENTEDKPDDFAELLLPASEYKKTLHRLLKRHITKILNLLRLNKAYTREEDDIIRCTRAKFLESDKTAQPSITNTPQAPNKHPPTYSVLPYYIKVLGKPKLPRKDAMSSFLNKYNPKSIKKHKTIHNLLFIGFTEKSDYESIFQADGIVIDGNTLSIRVCGKGTRTPDDNATTPNINFEEIQDTLNESADSNILGPELNKQIDDLLASINSTEDLGQNADNDNTNIDNGEALENDGDVIENAEADMREDGGNAVMAEALDNNDKVLEDVQQNENSTETNEDVEKVSEKSDQVDELKNTGTATPIRSSSRLAKTPATPSSIRTRRASRLIQK